MAYHYVFFIIINVIRNINVTWLIIINFLSFIIIFLKKYHYKCISYHFEFCTRMIYLKKKKISLQGKLLTEVRR